MTRIPPNHVKLYEAAQDIETSVPYATISADVFSLAIRRYLSWAQMLAAHPDSAASFGRAKAAHIQIATDLRTGLKTSQEQRTYPKIILSVGKYFAAMLFLAISRSVEPTIHELIEQENQKWEEDYIALFKGDNI